MKTFFVCSLSVTELNAKTLIFQSDSQTASTQTATSAPNTSARSVASTNTAQGVAKPSVATNAGNAQSTSSSVNSELFFMVEQLTQEVMQLRGLVEEQAYALRQLQDTAKDRYRDLDQRILELSKKEQRTAPTNASAVSITAPPVNGAIVPVAVASEAPAKSSDTALTASTAETDAQKAEYQAAYVFVRGKQFPQAVDALHAYVEKYPSGELTGNAFYWLGEVYLALPRLEQAKQALMIVVKTFPGHRKQADAMFKLAVTFDRLHNPAQAEIYLKQVQEKFPGSTAAKLAESYAINR